MLIHLDNCIQSCWRRQWQPTLAWKIPWTEEPGSLQSMGLLRVGHERLHFHFSLSCIGEGNGNPLQCFCLENPRDEGAWWAAIYGVTQSQTRLTRLSSSIQSCSHIITTEIMKGHVYHQKCSLQFLCNQSSFYTFPWMPDFHSVTTVSFTKIKNGIVQYVVVSA